MGGIISKNLILHQAQQIAKMNCCLLPGEHVGLRGAFGRFALTDIDAIDPVPTFAESTRDGYVIAAGEEDSGDIRRYRVVDEIPAGLVRRVERLLPGTACRIMTGGCVPEGSERVVPDEVCIDEGMEIVVEERHLRTGTTFVRQPGSDIAKGERLVAAGVQLQAEHLELLSSCGVHAVDVSCQPRVGYFCTGSELKDVATGLENGQKVSSNSFLLAGIAATYGAVSLDLGIVADTYQDLAEIFLRAGQGTHDVIVSTGGMGPGKYDLVEQAFCDAGGQVFFNSLAMRPGKSMLFGRLGKALFFGLPGPPHAVRALLHVLVGPALLAMQGTQDTRHRTIQAHLLHEVEAKRNNVLKLKEGVLVLALGKCSVRFTRKLEIGNCYIMLQPGCDRYAEGELVEVLVVADCFV